MPDERRYVPSLCEEVMTPFLTPRQVANKVVDFVSSLRKQAPAARMIGEFAVKHAAQEANKRLRPTDSAPRE